MPQIAERAGLTTRTYFRYFADKREVIFAGDEIPELARQIIAEAPAESDRGDDRRPASAVVESRFEGRRSEVAASAAWSIRTTSLRERDLRKRAAWPPPSATD